jgi:hypothetical protein
MGGPLLTIFGAKKYLWGNVPAYDVVKLASNEGNAYSGDLRLLFAGASLLTSMLAARSWC